MSNSLIHIGTSLITLLFCVTAFIGCKETSRGLDFNYEEKFIVQLDLGNISTSACIVNDQVYVLSGRDNHYYKINLESGETSYEKFPINFQMPTTIIHDGDRIIVSDITNRSLTFFDHNFRFKRRVVLNRYPMDFRIHKNRCVFLTDILHEAMYNYILVEENILSHREEIVFSGDTLNTLDFKNVLNLNTPGTLCYDYDGKYIYVAKQEYDSYIIHKFRPGQHSLTDDFINNREWSPVEYNESEYLQMKTIYSDILAMSNYPLDKLTFSHKLAILSITVDKRGWLWVVSSGVGDSLSLDIYSIDGEKVKNIVLSGIFKAKLLVSTNHFVLIETDDLHPRIFVYELIEK